MFYHQAISGACRAASDQFSVLLLTGPRQVGKTTLSQRLADKRRRYVTLDDPVVRALARQDPALFLERFEPPVLIDEIQYAPELLPLIKMAVDQRGRKRPSFWLTGSQQFQLMKGVSETLAGRVAILNLLGFSSRERHRRELDLPPFVSTQKVLKERVATGVALGLKRLFNDIWLGSLPAVAARAVRDRDLFYSSCLRTYLQRDVKDLARVGDEAAFLRFLKACAARTGHLLDQPVGSRRETLRQPALGYSELRPRAQHHQRAPLGDPEVRELLLYLRVAVRSGEQLQFIARPLAADGLRQIGVVPADRNGDEGASGSVLYRQPVRQEEAAPVPVVADAVPGPRQVRHEGRAARVGQQHRPVEASPAEPGGHLAELAVPRSSSISRRPLDHLVHPVPAANEVPQIRLHEKRDPRPWEPFADGPERGRGHDEIAHPGGQDDQDGGGLILPGLVNRAHAWIL